jgi:DNA gyrase subunit A
VSDIPEAERSSRGRSLHQLLGLAKTDRVCSLLSIARRAKEGVLVFVTEQGAVKRTPLDQFGTARAGGVNAMHLREGDRLRAVHSSDGGADLLLVSEEGRVIRFQEGDVPEMGRTAQGVRGMKLNAKGRVVGSLLVRRDATLCGVSERGYGSCIAAAEVTPQKRDGRGVVGFRLEEATGKLVGAFDVVAGDDLMLLTSGTAVRLRTDDVPLAAGGGPLSLVAALPGGARIAYVTRVAGSRGADTDQQVEPVDETFVPEVGADLPGEEDDRTEIAEETRAQYDLLG